MGEPSFGSLSKAESIPEKAISGQSLPPLTTSEDIAVKNSALFESFLYVTGPNSAMEIQKITQNSMVCKSKPHYKEKIGLVCSLNSYVCSKL